MHSEELPRGWEWDRGDLKHENVEISDGVGGYGKVAAYITVRGWTNETSHSEDVPDEVLAAWLKHRGWTVVPPEKEPTP